MQNFHRKNILVKTFGEKKIDKKIFWDKKGWWRLTEKKTYGIKKMHLKMGIYHIKDLLSLQDCIYVRITYEAKRSLNTLGPFGSKTLAIFVICGLILKGLKALKDLLAPAQLCTLLTYPHKVKGLKSIKDLLAPALLSILLIFA